MIEKETNSHILLAVTNVTNTIETHSSVKGDFGRPHTITHLYFKYKEPNGRYYNWDIVCERKYQKELFGLTDPVKVYCSWEKLSLYKMYPKAILEEPQLVSYIIDDRDAGFADKIREVSSCTLGQLFRSYLHVSLHPPLLKEFCIEGLAETLTDNLLSLEEELNLSINKEKETVLKDSEEESVLKKSILKSEKVKNVSEEEQPIEPTFDPYTRKLLRKINDLVDLKNVYAAVLEKHGLLKGADKLYIELIKES